MLVGHQIEQRMTTMVIDVASFGSGMGLVMLCWCVGMIFKIAKRVITEGTRHL